MKRQIWFLIFILFFSVPLSTFAQKSKRRKALSPKQRDKETNKAKKKKDKEKKKATKEAHKRHLGIQDKKVRKRLKRNRRKSNRKKKQ